MTKARENSDYTGLQGDLALKSPVASPVFTGNVGIGTTPSTALDVSGAAGITSFTGTTKLGVVSKGSTAATDYVGYDFIGNSQTNPVARIAALTTGGGSTLSFGTSNSYGSGITNTAMTIDSSGNVLVGKTSSTGATRGCELRSTGQGLFTNDSNWCVQVRMLNSTGNAVLFYKDTANVGSISVTGSATAYNTSSDYRLKTDVQPMTGATDRVKLLKPCNFEWISEGTRVDGFLAHEAQEVVPECATGTKDAMKDEEYEVTPAVLDDEGNETTAAVMGTRSVPDMQGIDQSKLVPLLTATIQELIARIEALEGE